MVRKLVRGELYSTSSAANNLHLNDIHDFQNQFSKFSFLTGKTKHQCLIHNTEKIRLECPKNVFNDASKIVVNQVKRNCKKEYL